MSYTLPKSFTQAESPSYTSNGSNTSFVMMGFAELITPINTSRILMVVSGSIENATATNGANIQLRYGTGTAPAHLDAVTGTQAGTTVFFDRFAGVNKLIPFAINAIISGFTIGTQYWFDLAVNSPSATAVNVHNISFSLGEV